MSARSTQSSSPDLFASAATADATPDKQAVAPKASMEPVSQPLPIRHLLPRRNLPDALGRLDNAEFDSLFAAVIDEAKRRDRMPSRTVKSQEPGQRRHNAPKSGAPETPTASHPRQTRTNDDEPALTRGQMNAVRAAFKAEVEDLQ